jgi:hypothetical protein
MENKKAPFLPGEKQNLRKDNRITRPDNTQHQARPEKTKATDKTRKGKRESDKTQDENNTTQDKA